jgi:hypothetical protein
MLLRTLYPGCAAACASADVLCPHIVKPSPTLLLSDTTQQVSFFADRPSGKSVMCCCRWGLMQRVERSNLRLSVRPASHASSRDTDVNAGRRHPRFMQKVDIASQLTAFVMCANSHNNCHSKALTVRCMKGEHLRSPIPYTKPVGNDHTHHGYTSNTST